VWQATKAVAFKSNSAQALTYKVVAVTSLCKH